ncbi:MAG: class I SAM-dependent methyltransferase [Chloroflexota bacterium]
MKRTSCSACGCNDLDQFLDLGESPIADAYTATADEVSPTYPLQVAVCAKCRLVQLLEVVDAETLFGTGYSFYSSASAPLSAYHAAYARDVLAKHGDLAARGMVEVGCNDGDLLRHFDPRVSLGVDPSDGPAAAAMARGCQVLVRPFGLAAAHEIRDRRGRQGLVIANHVLAHVEDVADVLSGISALLAADGVAMVEVQYLPDLLVNNAFDLVYHEHRNFFSLSSLEHAAHRHGLFVADAHLTDRQGGSLRVTLSRSHHHAAELSRVAKLRASETWLNSWGAYDGMQGRAERIRTRLQDLVAAQEGITAVYGAPAKATTLLNYCGLTSNDLTWCVDTTPAKQGRFIPGTGIPIVAPTFMGATTYVLAAWNYARPIMARNRDRQWIVPFPAPVLL